MKLKRVENAKRNMIYGVLNKCISLFFPFLIRAVVIRKLGADYLGLDSLFTSILQLLNLTELGFSSAIIYSMYKPIAENDMDALCELLAYYRTVYRVIGFVILLAGIGIIPLLPHFIRGAYPENLSIYILYIIYLVNTVLSYWLFAYKGAVLLAYQRRDIVDNISSVSRVIVYMLQIAAVILSRNYYIYVAALCIGTIINNLLTAYSSQKLFPEIVCRGRLHEETRKDVREKVGGLMIDKLCATSRNSFDSIIISSLLGLASTAMYGNYYYILYGISSCVNIFTNSISAGIGNSVAMESPEKNFSDMEKINFVYMWISGWCAICLFCMYQSFVGTVYGKDMLLSTGEAALFCIYFYLLKMGDIRYMYSSAKGLWWENRYRAVIESMANLVLNIVLGRLFGLYGILLATIVSLFVINFCWGSNIVFKHYFVSVSIRRYYRYHSFYAVVTCLLAGCTYYLCSFIMSYSVYGIAVKAFLCIIVPNLGYIFIYRRTNIYGIVKLWLKDRFLGV